MPKGKVYDLKRNVWVMTKDEMINMVAATWMDRWMEYLNQALGFFLSNKKKLWDDVLCHFSRFSFIIKK